MGPPRALRAAAVLGVSLFVGAACSEGEAPDYDAAYEQEFLAACTDAYRGAGGPWVCGCWYDAVSRTVAFADLPDLDDLVGDDFDGAPTRLPGGDLDVPLELLAACVRSLGAAPTLGDPVPLPTTPRPPTTPTTTTVVA